MDSNQWIQINDSNQGIQIKEFKSRTVVNGFSQYFLAKLPEVSFQQPQLPHR